MQPDADRLPLDAMSISAWPPDYPRGARFIVTGLEKAAHLNGLEVRILTWEAHKERLAVRVVSKVKKGDLEGFSVRTRNLERSTNWPAKLSDDELSGCLSKLPSWQDAACAAAACKTFRRLLKEGAWPKTGHESIPKHWSDQHVGGQPRYHRHWEERRPLPRPPQWSCGPPGGPVRLPTDLPSWTWALRDLPNAHDGNLPKLLQWLDVVEEKWQGVVVTRWPGVMKRLAWVQGLDETMGWQLTMADLQGGIRQNYRGTIMLSNYRDGDASADVKKAVPRCKFTLPADAALIFALMPQGLGEEATDDSDTHVYGGLDFVLEPWSLPPLPDLESLRPRADKKKLMFVATTCDCWDGFGPPQPDELDPDFWLCCDTESEMYGKILMATGNPRTRTFCLCWLDASLTDLLCMLTDATRETDVSYGKQAGRQDYAKADRGPRARDNGRGPWDLIWQQKHGTLHRLVKLAREKRVDGGGPR